MENYSVESNYEKKTVYASYKYTVLRRKYTRGVTTD